MTPKPRAVPATLEFALLRGAIEEIPLGVATTRGNDILYANNALERLYGAPPGGLDGRDLTALFDVETLRHLNAFLEKRRLYDGRVRARGFDGRPIYAELHAERYKSEAYGVGGFLVMRDVALELGALGRLVDLLGGVHVHFAVDKNKVEFVSPSVYEVIGISSEDVRTRPERLLDRVSAEERERLEFLYRRIVAGEMLNATAQLAIQTANGPVTMNLRATGRRDTSGDVSHVDAVVFPASPSSVVTTDPSARSIRPEAGNNTASTVTLAVVDLARELLREVSAQLQHAVQETRAARQVFSSGSPEMPDWLSKELEGGLGRVGDTTEAALAMTKRVRRGLESKSMSQPLRELLDGVSATLAPLLPGRQLAMATTDLGSLRVEDHSGELAIALVYLGLRAFRVAGSGALNMRVALVNEGEQREARIDFVGEGKADQTLGADVSTDVTLLTRQTEFDHAFLGVQVLLGMLGASIETDVATLERARTVVRVPVRG